MLRDNLRLLLSLYVRPVAAMGEIIDEGSLWFGAACVVLTSALFGAGAVAQLAGAFHASVAANLPSASVSAVPATRPPAPIDIEEPDETPLAAAPGSSELRYMAGMLGATGLVSTIAGLSLLYAPAAILIATLLHPIGSFGVSFRRDFGPVLACTYMAFSAAQLPAAALLLALPGRPLIAFAVCAAGALAFAAWMTVALRTALGLPTGVAAAAALLGLASFALLPFLAFLASPFLLYFAYRAVRGDIGDVLWSFRARQSFKRYLEAATINPRDAEAHYQLGLIHLNRRQEAEAVERFRRAVEIDPREIDAHYQLGRLARRQKRYEDALRHFEAVVAQDASYSRYEAWREIGGTYLDHGSFEQARWALDKYVGHRPHDPEGLYQLGFTRARLEDATGAREMFEKCIEAVDTTPRYLRHEATSWKRLARQQLSTPPAG